jgi:hypothetical protein
MQSLHVDGVGLWAPGFPDATAWGAGAEDAAVREVAGRPLPPALRRRATLLTRMVAEAAVQAAEQAGVELGVEPLVFGSAHGEIETAVEMMRSFEGPVGLPSPTRFHNSVHNTAVGYLSIATGNRGFVTALAAGRETTAATLLEASALIAVEGGGALVLLADEPVPAPFDREPRYLPAAAALYVRGERSARTRATLSALGSGGGSVAALDPRWAHHPCGGGLALVRAIVRGERGPVALAPADAGAWKVDVEPLT